ncbi:alpha-1-macroglobulin-like [Salarias fasciatus]|uniref:alpha-1-macroglobulin-like n=1 Tax=Salarias fasciatus TaxID=181472 RepID=UPI0011770ACB|nr:alpha-1-macroglobulin-like [Salarias fasciatus]
MKCLGMQMWTWTLCVLLSGICVSQAAPGPHYLVPIPAVLEAGAETTFCASVMEPNETLTITVTLVSAEENITLLTHTSDKDFHVCRQFQVPQKQEEVRNFKVEVRGNTFHSKEVRKVMIKSYQPITFVQTDKPIYLPGQTVNFRVVGLDSKLRPVTRLYEIIEIEDPNNNRIGQWLNETSDSVILQRSYSLNPEAREGQYQIIVKVGDDKIYQSFKVEKYVLPKFDLTLDVKDEISVKQEELKSEVCAKYTFGQPVPGVVKLKACRPLNRYMSSTYFSYELQEEFEITAPCHTETKETNKNGCATFTFMMSSFNKLDQKAVQDVLDVTAELEEEGTGVSSRQVRKITISYVIGTLSFIDTPQIYNKGTNVKGKVKAVDYSGKPIPDMPLYLFQGQRWSPTRLQNLTTDSEGLATFSVSTDSFIGDVVLQVSNTPTLEYIGYRVPFYDTKFHSLKMFQPVSEDTKTVSSLKVQKREDTLSCGKEEEIQIAYTVVGEPRGSVDFLYLILARGAILMQGFQKFEVQDKQVNQGTVSFKLEVSPDMAPEIQVVVYAVLPSENVIANSADFNVEKCFGHKVSLEFAPTTSVPGEEVDIQVTAQPDSLCGVSAVDQSVLIKEPGKTLEAEKIFNLLPVKKSTYIPYQAEDPTECLHVRPRRYIMPYPDSQEDPHSVFSNAGLKMVTNLFIRVPSCLKYRGREFHQGHGHYGLRYAVPEVARMHTEVAMAAPVPVGAGLSHYDVVDNAVIETVRTFFPETWIWDLVEVGDSGRKDIPLKVPDTITTWETEAFCLSPRGFGLAPRQKFTVFQPFFLELTMPYSVIRGESFELKATVFNYQSSCMMMSVEPTVSTDYTLTPLSDGVYTSCVCGSERWTVSWTMTPSTLGVVNVTVSAKAVASHILCNNEVVDVPKQGRVDTVTKPLVVKAEGSEVTDTYNWLLCPNGGALSEETDISLPANVIDGSARATVSVLGDILGRALKNLDGLLQMPYGCGEQNMALLAPNIYILQYLKGTEQLTPAIMEKAKNFLTSGYQRQLNYKHGDGAYSTFGTGAGNTWLTAFVLRSFSKAQSFIYIDPDHIDLSTNWLQAKQRENGCFEKSGKLFNNRMKGGVSDEVTLSAYITAAFLEMNSKADNPVVKNSLGCLKESMSNLSNTYTTALMAYVFSLAGDVETRDRLLQHLDSVAIREGGFLHWSQKATETSASLSVEISSYVLLAKLSGSPSAGDLGYASSIVRWLSRQQNSYGGFSSTQDTVVALQALALYSTLVFSPEGSSTVKVQAPSGPQLFEVNPNNKLLYQESALQDMAGKFSLEVKGSACASIQISVDYNIPTPTLVSTLSVKITTEVDTSKPTRPKLTLKLQSLYSGRESDTNMVILDIKVLSGFVPDEQSLKRLRGALLVDRVDRKEDHVQVYLRELPKDTPINHSLDLIQELQVKDLKPAVVKIYDYYQPSDQAETEYVLP